MNREDIQFSKENQIRNNRGLSFADAMKDSRMKSLGEGKGISFSFIEKERVIFPTLEEAFPYTKKFRETELLYITGYSERRNRFIEIPISSFRKRPVGEDELTSFYDEDVRPLNCRLAEASTDLDRFRILCEVGEIQCDEILDLHAWIFETDNDGKVHRTDRMKTLKVATISVVED